MKGAILQDNAHKKQRRRKGKDAERSPFSLEQVEKHWHAV